MSAVPDVLPSVPSAHQLLLTWVTLTPILFFFVYAFLFWSYEPVQDRPTDRRTGKTRNATHCYGRIITYGLSNVVVAISQTRKHFDNTLTASHFVISINYRYL